MGPYIHMTLFSILLNSSLIQISNISGVILWGLLKAAEDEGVFRQTTFFAARNFVDLGTSIVIDVIAVREPNDLLAEMGAMILGDDGFVGDKIIKIARAHGAGIGQYS